jgi:glutamate-1-semialdehyde 2,1-aminomutase
VQPGVGNPLAPRETYTLKDMDEASLRVLRSRPDIACVLVNPLQALHPNVGAPGDSTLIDSGRTRTSTAPPIRRGCNGCARCARRAASC